MAEVDPNLKRSVQQIVNHLVQQATEVYQREFATPSIHYIKCGTYGGFAYSYPPSNVNGVILHPTMLQREPDKFRETIVPHEVAHTICMQMYGLNYLDDARPHGRLWRDVMRRFGAEPKASHTMNSSGLKPYSNQKFVKDLSRILVKDGVEQPLIVHAAASIAALKPSTVSSIITCCA